MRRFFLLTYDGSRTDLQVVSGYSMGPFDPPHFGRVVKGQKPSPEECSQSRPAFDSACIRQGEKLAEPVPQGVRLWVSKGGLRDLLANPLSWLILSKRLFNLFCRYATDDMQVVDVPILNEGSDEPVDDYKVVNLLRVVCAANMEQSQVLK